MDNFALILCLLTLILTRCNCGEEDESIIVAGYGVEFARTFQIQKSVSKWEYTFILSLSELNLDINDTACIPDFCPLHPSFDDHTWCRYFHDSIQVLQSQATIVINEINHYRSICPQVLITRNILALKDV